ncbi:putative zinc finger and BTB domain-containing protein 16-A [Triplophysa rosa]|uniref:Zinc finger and BTB domain-containing protein 16-A n=1 Tax=Triplophysa rosa TaxID=992332 RepID=A0A9W7WE43_TRIRA|nr:putative zinc finger and BTB domain-containing protein 16-A [Triplophysa rosa]
MMYGLESTGEKLHSGMKTYGCELCGKRFLDSLRLRMHLLSHSAGEKAIVCDQCGAQFQKEDALEAHRQIHTASEWGICLYACDPRNDDLRWDAGLEKAGKARLMHVNPHTGASAVTPHFPDTSICPWENVPLDRLVEAQKWLVEFGARSLREKQHHVLLLTHSPSATGVSVLTYFKGQPNLKSLQLRHHLSQGTAMKNSLMKGENMQTIPEREERICSAGTRRDSSEPGRGVNTFSLKPEIVLTERGEKITLRSNAAVFWHSEKEKRVLFLGSPSPRPHLAFPYHI